jgi:hypothetical protein
MAHERRAGLPAGAAKGGAVDGDGGTQLARHALQAAARFTVSPITVQMKRSDDWYSPTNRAGCR